MVTDIPHQDLELPSLLSVRQLAAYLDVPHASCNRAAGAAVAHGRWYEDDPARGIFWGPPSEPGGMPMRWSRQWYEWREPTATKGSKLAKQN
jgi:hypothetical protein